MPRVLVRLDDRMMDLDKPVTVTHNGKALYTGTPARTIGGLIRTLVGRGDPKLMFDAEVAVEVPAPAAGVMGALQAQEGDTVTVGAVIATIEDSTAAGEQTQVAERTEKARDMEEELAARVRTSKSGTPASSTPAM